MTTTPGGRRLPPRGFLPRSVTEAMVADDSGPFDKEAAETFGLRLDTYGYDVRTVDALLATVDDPRGRAATGDGLDAVHAEISERLWRAARGSAIDSGLDAALRETLLKKERHGLVVGLLTCAALEHGGFDAMRCCALALAFPNVAFLPFGDDEPDLDLDLGILHHEGDRTLSGRVPVDTRVSIEAHDLVRMPMLPDTIRTLLPRLRLAQVLSHPAFDHLDVRMIGSQELDLLDGPDQLLVRIEQPGYLRMSDLVRRADARADRGRAS